MSAEMTTQERLEKHGLLITTIDWNELSEDSQKQLADAMDAALEKRRLQQKQGLENAAKGLPGPLLRRVKKMFWGDK